MKRSLWLTLAALCLAATALEAQTCPTPVVPATYQGTFIATYSHGECSSTSKKTDFEWGVCVWLTGDGGIEYTVDVGTVRVTAVCGGGVGLSMEEILGIVMGQMG